MSAKVSFYRDPEQRWGLAEGDALRLLARLPERSADAVVCDPPYAIEFHGEGWDRQSDPTAFMAWTSEWAGACRRLLKPGGYLLAFGAPRTFHRLVAGVEDTGLEIRDVLMWLFGQGLPKSRRLPGGRGTALKPAYEPILLARAPLDDTLAATRRRWDTGTLAIDAASIKKPGEPQRWPANVVLSHAAGCTARSCSDGCAAALLDQAQPRVEPSRFFYSAKATVAEREAGCECLPGRVLQVFTGPEHPPRWARNHHPTVKPVALMRWLVRLAVPEGGIVLDPFTGSGSTGVAAVLEGRGFFGIEREAAYVQIATARLAHWTRRENT
jgi:site-specific DNA-methyltransferase (adenine-specific)